MTGKGTDIFAWGDKYISAQLWISFSPTNIMTSLSFPLENKMQITITETVKEIKAAGKWLERFSIKLNIEEWFKNRNGLCLTEMQRIPIWGAQTKKAWSSLLRNQVGALLKDPHLNMEGLNLACKKLTCVWHKCEALKVIDKSLNSILKLTERQWSGATTTETREMFPYVTLLEENFWSRLFPIQIGLSLSFINMGKQWPFGSWLVVSGEEAETCVLYNVLTVIQWKALRYFPVDIYSGIQ